MSNPIVVVNGKHSAVSNLLGAGPLRIPTAGKVRAGIKILTKRAAENPTAREIYERGVAQSQSFDEIERAITQAIPDLKNPLVPKNVPWFSVRPQDFPNPEIARQIMDAFAEDRGDGVKRLYRFPIIFPADQWQIVMPHELVAWGAYEKKYWSEYAADGSTRLCKCYAPVQDNSGGRRAIRIFGGRKTMLRSENDGLCEPDRCAEYQTRQCNLSCRFIFYLPGIRSIDAFELHTNSFYAMRRAIEKLEAVAFLRGGRLSGFLDDHHASFFLSKKQVDLTHIDETGKAVRSPQWIIELEAPIDVTLLLRANGDDMARSRADAAAITLEGENPAPVSIQSREIAGVPGMARPEVRMPQREDAGPNGKVVERGQTGPSTDGNGALRQDDNGTGPSVDHVLAAAGEFGIEAARFEAYADRRWGTGWRFNAQGRRRVLEEIQRYRNDPEGLADKIDAELRAT